jgi:hypothetical protein
MQGWHTPHLGLRDLPREISAFELQAFLGVNETGGEGGSFYAARACKTGGGYHRLKFRTSCPFRAAQRTCSR